MRSGLGSYSGDGCGGRAAPWITVMLTEYASVASVAHPSDCKSFLMQRARGRQGQGQGPHARRPQWL